MANNVSPEVSCSNKRPNWMRILLLKRKDPNLKRIENFRWTKKRLQRKMNFSRDLLHLLKSCFLLQKKTFLPCNLLRNRESCCFRYTLLKTEQKKMLKSRCIFCDSCRILLLSDIPGLNGKWVRVWVRIFESKKFYTPCRVRDKGNKNG